MVHSARMAPAASWSFEDEVCQEMDDAAFRRVPQKESHSIAWILWHIARIEDVTMNLLLAGEAQVWRDGGWSERMGVRRPDTGNTMDEEAVAALGASIDIKALLAYRFAVGRRTQQLVRQLQPEGLKQKVDPARLQRLRTEGAVVDAAGELIDYCGGLTYAGLLLMPPTRHNFIHLNEAVRIKKNACKH